MYNLGIVKDFDPSFFNVSHYPLFNNWGAVGVALQISLILGFFVMCFINRDKTPKKD